MHIDKNAKRVYNNTNLNVGAIFMNRKHSFAAAYFYFYFIGNADKVFCCV